MLLLHERLGKKNYSQVEPEISWRGIIVTHDCCGVPGMVYHGMRVIRPRACIIHS